MESKNCAYTLGLNVLPVHSDGLRGKNTDFAIYLKKSKLKFALTHLWGGAGRECVHAALYVWVRGQFLMVSSLPQVLETGTQFASLVVRTCTHQTILSALNT